jgi:hypothetical protein
MKEEKMSISPTYYVKLLYKSQAIEEIRHFRKCVISAIACDIYTCSLGVNVTNKCEAFLYILFLLPLLLIFLSLQTGRFNALDTHQPGVKPELRTAMLAEDERVNYEAHPSTAKAFFYAEFR